MEYPKDVLERFYGHFTEGESDECWPWVGGNVEGYGVFRRGPDLGNDGRLRPMRAHRFALELKLGRALEGLALHHCDNPPCVNPAHLYEGTHTDNAQDKVRRGRNTEASKTHCKRGHAFTPENTYQLGTSRYCRACGAWRAREAKRKRHECERLVDA